MGKLVSKKGKGTYAEYKADNRAEKNKIKKLERHCKLFPNDEIGKNNLASVLKKGFKPRAKPLQARIFVTEPKVKRRDIFLVQAKTAGEQLGALLNIPVPQVKEKVKTIIKHKPRRK
jgi:hypothetical protein